MRVMRSISTLRLVVGITVVAAGVTGAVAPAAAAAAICPVPRLMTVPAVHRVVGNGTRSSCTAAAARRAIAAGGSVRFDCGTAPITVRLDGVLPVTKTTVIDGAGRVTLDGQGRTRILDVADHAALSVRGLRLVNAMAHRSDPDGGAGGAISGGYAVRVEVVRSEAEGNAAARGGGAVYVGNASRLTIVDSRFEQNRARLGGAVYSLLSSILIFSSTFRANRATADSGGAILTDGAAPRDASAGGSIAVCRSSIVSNRAGGQGGGAFLWGYGRDHIVLYRMTFERNVAGSAGRGLGGGARVSIAPEGGAQRSGSIDISRVAFVENRSGGDGGGAYLNCAPRCGVRNSTFSGNVATGFGGAIAGDGHRDNGVTYVGNRARAGGALAGRGVVLRNVLFSANSAREPGFQTCIERNAGTRVLQWGTRGPDDSASCATGLIQRDPRLSALVRHSGGAPVAIPGRGSGALHRGTGCLARDALGRVRGVVCDLGAVERTG